MIAGASPLHSEFISLYERLRAHRNKIAHLNAGNIRVEAEKILIDILAGYKYLFPDVSWIGARKASIRSRRDVESEYIVDWTHSDLMREMDIMLSTLGSTDEVAGR